MIYHLTKIDRLYKARETGVYRSERFDRDGFIHCCEVHQLELIANNHFGDEELIAVLELNPVMLTAKTNYEHLDGGGEKYPHVYGEIPFKEISRVVLVNSHKDGSYDGVFKDVDIR